MLLTELNGPRSSQPRSARSRRFSSSFRLSLAAILLFTGSAANAATAFAQEQQGQQTEQDQQQPSVADAARQERARKQQQAPKEQTKTAKHVYTDEDLKRSHILTREDQAAVEARKTECAQNPQKNNCAPSASRDPGALDANSQQPSLGEVARQYRKQKELQALQPKQSQPFHLSIGESALASPILPEHPALRPPTPPVLSPGISNSEIRATAPRTSESHPNISRRDPFAPVPTRPRVPFDGTSQLRPAARLSAKSISPAAPKISAAPMPPAKLFSQPSQPAPANMPAQRETSSSRSAFHFESVRPSSQNKSAQPKNPGSPSQAILSFVPAAPVSIPQAQPERPSLQLQPVRPIVPSKSIQRSSLVAPAIVFHTSMPLPLTGSTKTNPITPVPSELPNSTASVEPRSARSSSAAPVAPTSKIIRVQSGDSLWKLARHNLGRGALWTQLRAANPAIADPRRLPVGAELALPNPLPVFSVLPSPAQQQNMEQTSRRTSFSTLKVRHGDTLWSLAKQLLGNPAAWPCLAAANPSVADPNRIFAGQELILPTTCR